MKVELRAKQPPTLAERAEAARDEAVELAHAAPDRARELARSVPERLDSGRNRAIAVAGVAAGAAAGLAFWRSHSSDEPSVHDDPVTPSTPLATTAPPPTDGQDPVGSGTEA